MSIRVQTLFGDAPLKLLGNMILRGGYIGPKKKGESLDLRSMRANTRVCLFKTSGLISVKFITSLAN
jgi:hypothetical protein